MPQVGYMLDDGTVARFEIDLDSVFRPAGADEVIGRLRDAVSPAIEAAASILQRLRKSTPDEVELKFGIKVDGTMNWVVAKVATEGNFEVTLRWNAPHASKDEVGPQ